MKPEDALKLRSTSGVSRFAADATASSLGHVHHGHALSSTRQIEHEGRKVVITTTYEITIDGHPLHTHVFVNNDGTLHSHAVPNYTFVSTVDLVKKIIDLFPELFPSSADGGDHGGHTQEHP